MPESGALSYQFLRLFRCFGAPSVLIDVYDVCLLSAEMAANLSESSWYDLFPGKILFSYNLCANGSKYPTSSRLRSSRMKEIPTISFPLVCKAPVRFLQKEGADVPL